MMLGLVIYIALALICLVPAFINAFGPKRTVTYGWDTYGEVTNHVTGEIARVMGSTNYTSNHPPEGDGS